MSSFSRRGDGDSEVSNDFPKFSQQVGGKVYSYISLLQSTVCSKKLHCLSTHFKKKNSLLFLSILDPIYGLKKCLEPLPQSHLCHNK